MNLQAPTIGVERAHLTELTSDTSSAHAYGSPDEMPGAVEVAIVLNSNTKRFYGDNVALKTALENGDATIMVTIFGISNEKASDMIGETYSTANGLSTSGRNDPKPLDYALQYRRENSDKGHTYLCWKKGNFSKPDHTDTTKAATITEQYFQFTFTPIHRTHSVEGLDDFSSRVDSEDTNLPSGVTDATLNSSVTGFFSNPDFLPTATGTPIADLAASTGASSGEIALAFSAPTGAVSVVAQVEELTGWLTVATTAPIVAVSTTAIIPDLIPDNLYNCRLVVQGGTNDGISNEDDATALT